MTEKLSLNRNIVSQSSLKYYLSNTFDVGIRWWTDFNLKSYLQSQLGFEFSCNTGCQVSALEYGILLEPMQSGDNLHL